jgi:hypothetical protein
MIEFTLTIDVRAWLRSAWRWITWQLWRRWRRRPAICLEDIQAEPVWLVKHDSLLDSLIAESAGEEQG